jgi:pyruvate formate lyase activating enzyme
VWWLAKNCIGCGACVEACPKNALHLSSKNGIQIQRALCTGCGKCVEVCPSKAMELLGKEWSVEEAAAYLLRDRMFYETSSGGITLSGGEPTLQPQFVLNLFQQLKKEGIHTALDTCGLAQWTVFEQLLPVTDLFLWDIKTTDPQIHKKYTEASNKIILENLQKLAEALRAGATSKLWIRTPLIPGITATPSNIHEIAAFIHHHLSDVAERWELCAFNGGCTPKYQRLNQKWSFADQPAMTHHGIQTLKEALSDFPQLASKTHFTGLIKPDEKN